jgi:hypothetical protein
MSSEQESINLIGNSYIKARYSGYTTVVLLTVYYYRFWDKRKKEPFVLGTCRAFEIQFSLDLNYI